MDLLVRNSEKIPLNYNDIKNVIKLPNKYMNYDEVKNYENLEELFGKYNIIIMFLPNKTESIGHWICLLKYKQYIEYFDPYGLTINQEMNILGLDNSLKKLYQLSKKKVVFNNFQYQKLRKNINDCARHCAVRCCFYTLNVIQYHKLIISANMDSDDLITLLTLLSMPKHKSIRDLLNMTNSGYNIF